MFITVLAAMAALAQGSPASAAASAAVSGPETEALQEPDRIVCKSERQLGSRMSKQTCRTKAEWAKIAADFRAAEDRREGHKRRGSPKFAK